jgi:hypothetical protein
MEHMFEPEPVLLVGQFRSPPGPTHTEPPDLRPVWVRLDVLYRHPSDAPQTAVGDGLDLVGSVPGLLSGWMRSARGMWLGVCNFAIPYADGRPQPHWVHDQLVPGHALRPRHQNDGG